MLLELNWKCAELGTYSNVKAASLELCSRTQLKFYIHTHIHSYIYIYTYVYIHAYTYQLQKREDTALPASAGPAFPPPLSLEALLSQRAGQLR